ncbi:MAG: PHP domain-containing protein, partial [Actinobacteria bacterium]|nr:PHP domain-containing protein [Actinomycetota bacterium]
MINLKLSSILTTIAEISKFKHNEVENVINLSKAARTVRDYDYDIRDAYNEGLLKKLPGIDEFAYKIISEYFERGSIKLFDQLREKYPEDLIKIVRLSGIGTKKVFEIYEKFNIRTLEDLKDLFSLNYDIKKLAQTNDIESIFLERVAHSARYLESLKGRCPRWLVLKYAEKIVEGLSHINEILSLKIVGSLRRRKAEVGDIDILVLPEFNIERVDIERSKELISKIRELFFIKNLVSDNFRKENISVKFSTIFDIDTEIIITSKKMWPNDLLITTGSKNHILKLRSLAEEKGCINDQIFDFSQINFKRFKCYKNNDALYEDDDFICPEEKQIYEFLGIDYIVPELREGFNEVELAKENYLPNLIKISDIRGDLHIHSKYSDGIMDMQAVLKKMKKYDYEYISFSDHSESNKYGNGLDKKRLCEKEQYLNELNKKHNKFSFLMGSEIEIDKDGNLDYDDSIISKFDIALGSMHRGFKFDSSFNNARFERAMQNKYIDIIAHPTGAVFGSRAPYFLDVDRLIDAALRYNKAVEINSYFLRLDLNEENTRKAKKSDILIAINTDSHRINNIDMMKL